MSPSRARGCTSFSLGRIRLPQLPVLWTASNSDIYSSVARYTPWVKEGQLTAAHDVAISCPTLNFSSQSGSHVNVQWNVYVTTCRYKPTVSEMTYTVLSGTLNSTIPYHTTINLKGVATLPCEISCTKTSENLRSNVFITKYFTITFRFRFSYLKTPAPNRSLLLHIGVVAYILPASEADVHAVHQPHEHQHISLSVESMSVESRSWS